MPRSPGRPRPAPGELEAARGRAVPDVVVDGLRLLLVGINPGLWTAWSGHHFARPGNRFWTALHAAGITPRVLVPSEERELLALGIGITNMVPRATAAADELSRDEIRAGDERLQACAAVAAYAVGDGLEIPGVALVAHASRSSAAISSTP